jgi:hypothetical protein
MTLSLRHSIVSIDLAGHGSRDPVRIARPGIGYQHHSINQLAQSIAEL